MRLNDPRPSASTSPYGYDVQQADNFKPACSPSFVGGSKHASMKRSVSRTAGGGWRYAVETKGAHVSGGDALHRL